MDKNGTQQSLPVQGEVRELKVSVVTSVYGGGEYSKGRSEGLGGKSKDIVLCVYTTVKLSCRPNKNLCLSTKLCVTNFSTRRRERGQTCKRID